MGVELCAGISREIVQAPRLKTTGKRSPTEQASSRRSHVSGVKVLAFLSCSFLYHSLRMIHDDPRCTELGMLQTSAHIPLILMLIDTARRANGYLDHIAAEVQSLQPFNVHLIDQALRMVHVEQRKGGNVISEKTGSLVSNRYLTF
jgi:hypothetical protein